MLTKTQEFVTGVVRKHLNEVCHELAQQKRRGDRRRVSNTTSRSHVLSILPEQAVSNVVGCLIEGHASTSRGLFGEQ